MTQPGIRFKDLEIEDIASILYKSLYQKEKYENDIAIIIKTQNDKIEFDESVYDNSFIIKLFYFLTTKLNKIQHPQYPLFDSLIYILCEYDSDDIPDEVSDWVEDSLQKISMDRNHPLKLFPVNKWSEVEGVYRKPVYVSSYQDNQTYKTYSC